jgi:hypothetical protein
MDWDPTSLITPVGVLGCLVALFTALWRGWLWTGPQVAKLEAGYKMQIEAEQKRTDEWRGIALKTIANADKLAPQLDAVLAGQEVQRNLLAALREKAGQK